MSEPLYLLSLLLPWFRRIRWKLRRFWRRVWYAVTDGLIFGLAAGVVLIIWYHFFVA